MTICAFKVLNIWPLIQPSLYRLTEMDYSLLIICVHLKKLKYTRSKSNTPGVANKQSCNMVHQYRIQSMWVIQSQCIIRVIFILYQQCFCTNICGKHLGWRIKLSVKTQQSWDTHISREKGQPGTAETDAYRCATHTQEVSKSSPDDVLVSVACSEVQRSVTVRVWHVFPISL